MKIEVAIRQNPEADSDYPEQYSCEIKFISAEVAKKSLDLLETILKLPFNRVHIEYSAPKSTKITGIARTPYTKEKFDKIFDTIRKNLKTLKLSD